jgi:glycolate oxidase
VTTEYAELVSERATGKVSDRVRQEIASLVAPGGVISEPAQLRTYECDGLTGYRVTPALVVLPVSTEEVAAVVKVCAREHIPFVARGAGTGLSGGSLPVADGIVIGLSRMRTVLAVDPENRRAVVQPGVTNSAVSAAVAEHGLYYAPDPSSQIVCTIGGNVAENSGGAHCLKYGFTTNHVLGLTFVAADGSVTRLGGNSLEPAGFGLMGVIIGSEGTLGIVTEVTVRLLRKPQAVRTLVADFADVEQAGNAVSGIIAAGIVPAAVEMLDLLAIEACEKATGAGYTIGCPAALVVERTTPTSAR